jgi:hypothetical protein
MFILAFFKGSAIPPSPKAVINSSSVGAVAGGEVASWLFLWSVVGAGVFWSARSEILINTARSAQLATAMPMGRQGFKDVCFGFLNLRRPSIFFL